MKKLYLSLLLLFCFFPFISHGYTVSPATSSSAWEVTFSGLDYSGGHDMHITCPNSNQFNVNAGFGAFYDGTYDWSSLATPFLYSCGYASPTFGVYTFEPLEIATGLLTGEQTFFEYLDLVYGCTYVEATNYNSLADLDDGSCSFPAFSTTTIVMASTTEAVYKAAGTLSFGVAVLIALMSLILISFIFSSIKKKKPWQRS